MREVEGIGKAVWRHDAVTVFPHAGPKPNATRQC